MLRVPDQSPGPIHHEWTPAELVRTNDVVLLSAIEALLTDAHIPYLVTDRNVSVVAGSIEALPRRILVGDCCIADAHVSWLPFIALIGVWIFLSRQVGAARGKDKRSIDDLKRQIDDIRRRLDRLTHNSDDGD